MAACGFPGVSGVLINVTHFVRPHLVMPLRVLCQAMLHAMQSEMHQ
jgi:hypothetical protein